MAQQKYLKLNHFQPDGYPKVYPGNSDEVRAMMPELIKKVPLGWTKIPNHDLEVFATRQMAVPSLGFRKGKKEVYVHVFCNEFINPVFAMQIVLNLYRKYNFGQPSINPEEPNWIHSIPLPGAKLSAEEIVLIHQITQSLFWTIFENYQRLGTG